MNSLIGGQTAKKRALYVYFCGLLFLIFYSFPSLIYKKNNFTIVNIWNINEKNVSDRKELLVKFPHFGTSCTISESH